jgi:hypothetical protein
LTTQVTFITARYQAVDAADKSGLPASTCTGDQQHFTGFYIEGYVLDSKFIPVPIPESDLFKDKGSVV